MSRRRTLLRAAVLVVVAGAATDAGGQPPGDVPPAGKTFSGSGTEMFRGLLDYHGITPLKSLKEFDAERDRSKVIVLVLRPGGGPVSLADLGRRIPPLVKAGGASLIATNVPDPYLGSRCLPDTINISVVSTGEQVSQTRGHEAQAFGDRLDRPFVQWLGPTAFQTGFLDPAKRPPEWSVFADKSRVATSGPSVLHVTGSSQYVDSVLARYPDGCAARLPNGRARRLTRNDLFAAGGSGPPDRPFRSLFLADPDVFSNRLIAAADEAENQATDNFAFAVAVVRFLRGPESAPKTKCLFVDAGRIETDFEAVKYEGAPLPPLPPLPLPPLTDPAVQRKLAETLDRFVATKEDEDALNQAVAGTNTKYAGVARGLAVAAAVAVLIVGILRAWRSRYSPDLAPVPTDTGRVAGSAPPGSLARRREEAVQAGDYGEYVREYLRDLFAAQGAPSGPAATGPPPVRATGPDAKAVRDDVRILWGVAYDPAGRPVPYSRWKELEPMIDAVWRAAAEGRWRFAPASSGGAA